MGVRLGQPGPTAKDGMKALPPQQDSWPIENIIDGADFSTELGPVFVAQKNFPTNYTHGDFRLDTFPEMNMMAAWGKASRLSSLDKSQIAFLDTETTGLSGGTGTYAFLIGLGYFVPQGFVVNQYFLRGPAQEPALLAAISEKLGSYEAIVTFNGKSFDLPLLATRFTLNRIHMSFIEVDHIDLLHLARRIWRNRLASRALGDLERDILGFSRSEAEVPGYLIPQYYFDYLSSGDARPLLGVFNHNGMDIVSMAALFEHMSEILEHPNQTSLHSLDVVAVARLYEEHGKLEQAADLYEAGIAAGLPEIVFFNTITRFANLRKRQELYDQAASLLEKAARLGSLEACRELSKVFEHNLRRPSVALDWVLHGLTLLDSINLPGYQIQIYREDFNKRVERLRKKGKL